MFKDFIRSSKASFVIGGQWGSEGKGAAAAYLARWLGERGTAPDVITTNAGAQAGHTSTHNGVTRVAFHLPTATLIAGDYGLRPLTYLNAGAIIDPDVLERELRDAKMAPAAFFIHPNAAVITDDCREAEGRAGSAQTKIASTRKGVGEALARKVLRSGVVAKDHRVLNRWVSSLFNLPSILDRDGTVLVEVPQGIGLSLNEQFYPHCTSRNCTVMQAMSDADIHPTHYGSTLLVLRTYPIRVGNIPVPNDTVSPDMALLGHSGGCYVDQKEITWSDLGVKPEITTVTKRVRRVFTFSRMQAHRAMQLTRPTHVQLTFCDYPGPPGYVADIRDYLLRSARDLGLDPPTFLYQYGPTTDDVYPEIR